MPLNCAHGGPWVGDAKYAPHRPFGAAHRSTQSSTLRLRPEGRLSTGGGPEHGRMVRKRTCALLPGDYVYDHACAKRCSGLDDGTAIVSKLMTLQMGDAFISDPTQEKLAALAKRSQAAAEKALLLAVTRGGMPKTAAWSLAAKCFPGDAALEALIDEASPGGAKAAPCSCG